MGAHRQIDRWSDMMKLILFMNMSKNGSFTLIYFHFVKTWYFHKDVTV